VTDPRLLNRKDALPQGDGAPRLMKRTQEIPKPRGPFMRADAIAKDPTLFNGAVSPRWVLRKVPHKVKLGHSTCGWFREDVEAFIEERRQSA
jgi:hypothetical protein